MVFFKPICLFRSHVSMSSSRNVITGLFSLGANAKPSGMKMLSTGINRSAWGVLGQPPKGDEFDT